MLFISLVISLLQLWLIHKLSTHKCSKLHAATSFAIITPSSILNASSFVRQVCDIIQKFQLVGFEKTSLPRVIGYTCNTRNGNISMLAYNKLRELEKLQIETEVAEGESGTQQMMAESGNFFSINTIDSFPSCSLYHD